MTKFRLNTVLVNPQTLKDFSDARTEMTTIGINALTGIFTVLAAGLAMSSFFTNGLIILATFLFGPLVGFLISSTYPRIEWVVGRKFGGKASLNDTYRIFAWSFLLVGFALLFYSLIMQVIDKPSVAVGVLLSLPSAVLALLAIRSYSYNTIAAQKLTATRGGAGMVITAVLFVLLIAGCVSLIWLLYRYGASENIKAL